MKTCGPKTIDREKIDIYAIRSKHINYVTSTLLNQTSVSNPVNQLTVNISLTANHFIRHKDIIIDSDKIQSKY